MDDLEPPKRKSLRDSVLKRSSRSRNHHIQTYDDENKSRSPPEPFFGGLESFFDNENDSFSFGIPDMNRFSDHINEMMSRFFSDFEPESFTDSPTYKEDRDLDDDISRRGLDKALDRRQNFESPNVFMRGFSHSESTVTRPDGSVERKVTHKDSQGNVKSTVTITRPDGTTETFTDNFESEQDEGTAISDYNHPGLTPFYDSGRLFQKIFDNIRSFF